MLLGGYLILGNPNNKFKALIEKNTCFSILKSIKFPFITQLKYCQKLDVGADPINKFRTLILKKNYFVRFQNQFNFFL